MFYNDFQILTTNQYEILAEQFKHKNFSKMSIAEKLLSKLEECKSYCYGLDNQLNKQIQASLQQTKIELDKLIDNTNLLFNISPQPKNIVEHFNVFCFLKNLVTIIKLSQQLQEADKNNTQFAQATIKTIANALNNIIEKLEQSNIKIFKYM